MHDLDTLWPIHDGQHLVGPGQQEPLWHSHNMLCKGVTGLGVLADDLQHTREACQCRLAAHGSGLQQVRHNVPAAPNTRQR